MKIIIVSCILFIFCNKLVYAQVYDTSNIIFMDTISFKNLMTKHLNQMELNHKYDTFEALELLRIYNSLAILQMMENSKFSVTSKTFIAIFESNYSYNLYELLQVGIGPGFTSYSHKHDIYFMCIFQESDYIHLR